MRKFLLIILCLTFLSEAYLLFASMPVAVKITGCIVKGYLVSEETDFGTHIDSHKESPYKIKAVDNTFNPVNLSSFEGKKIRVRGELLPGDQFIIEPESIENLGLCLAKTASSTKKDIPKKSKLSNLYLLADENKKMIGEEKAQELIWSLPEVKEHSKRIKNMGKRPFTRIDARPEDASGNGNFYIVYFGEDHGARVVNIMTFYVNAYTQRIYVYEPIFDTKYHIEQWRMMQ